MIPSDRRALPEKESETWTVLDKPESTPLIDPESIAQTKIPEEKPPDENLEQQLPARNHETRKSSKGKRVKSYLKKCKGALTTKTDDASGDRRKQEQSNASWYVEGKKEAASSSKEEVEDVRPEEIFELCKRNSRTSKSEEEDEEVATVVEAVLKEEEEEDGALNKCDSSDTLIAESKEDSDEEGPVTPTFIPNATVVRTSSFFYSNFLITFVQFKDVMKVSHLNIHTLKNVQLKLEVFVISATSIICDYYVFAFQRFPV